MGAEAHDVLQEQLPIAAARLRAVARQLQPQAAELGERVVDHRARALRREGLEPREVGCAERAGRHEADGRRARAQPVVSQPDAPDAGELVDALQVPARLARAVVAARRTERSAVQVVGQRALLAPPEVLALQLEARGRAVAGRRPLEHAVEHVDVAVAGEGVDDGGAGAVDVLVRAVDALRRAGS